MDVGGVRERLARRAAKEVEEGMVVNLGIGIPTLIADFLPPGGSVHLQAENGVFGYSGSPVKGEEDGNLVNAGGFPITVLPGASYFDSALAFGMIRRGRLDMTFLGALQVSESGDLANWLVPGRRVPGYGGAIELAQKARRVVVLTTHTNREGDPKIVRECTYPLTAPKAVDLIITDMAVISVGSEGLTLEEVAREHSLEEVLARSGAPLRVAESLGTF